MDDTNRHYVFREHLSPALVNKEVPGIGLGISRGCSYNILKGWYDRLLGQVPPVPASASPSLRSAAPREPTNPKQRILRLKF